MNSVLVPIQPTGEGLPFFCVHPVGGTVFCYAALARHIGARQRVYALQAAGLTDDVAIARNIAVMAEFYVSAIRSVQERGPYLLGGWSMGGLIALEMAHILKNTDDQVGLVVLIDTAPRLDTITGVLGDDDPDQVFLRYFAADLLGLGSARDIDLSRVDEMTRSQQMQYILDYAARADIPLSHFEPGMMSELFEVFRDNLLAEAAYEPRPYPDDVLLVKASASLREFPDADDYGWEALCPRVRGVSVRGDHYSIMREPSITEIAKHVGAALTAARVGAVMEG